MPVSEVSASRGKNAASNALEQAEMRFPQRIDARLQILVLCTGAVRKERLGWMGLALRELGDFFGRYSAQTLFGRLYA